MNATVNIAVAMAGLTASSNTTHTQDGVVGINPVCDVASAGELTVRGSTSAGTIAVDDTTLVTGNSAVVTWVDTDGVTLKHRYSVAVTVTPVLFSGVTASYNIAISGGAGDDLPALNSDITIGKQIPVEITFDPDDVDTFCVTTNVRGVVVFHTGADVASLVMDMGTNGIGVWTKNSGFTAPMSGDPITHVLVGGGSTTAFAPKVLVLYDASVGSGQ